MIKLAARADLHHLGLFLEGRQSDAPQEALQVLDIVLRELPTTRLLIKHSYFCIEYILVCSAYVAAAAKCTFNCVGIVQLEDPFTPLIWAEGSL